MLETGNDKLYCALKARKNSGEALDFSSITREEMYQLWHVEAYPDSMIASLYDVPVSQVTKKRKDEFGLNQFDCMINSYFERLKTHPLVKNIRENPKLTTIVEKVDELSFIDKKILAAYLLPYVE